MKDGLAEGMSAWMQWGHILGLWASAAALQNGPKHRRSCILCGLSTGEPDNPGQVTSYFKPQLSLLQNGDLKETGQSKPP